MTQASESKRGRTGFPGNLLSRGWSVVSARAVTPIGSVADRVAAWAMVGLFSGACLLMAAPLLQSGLLLSDDLAGHVALVQRLGAQLSAGNDPWFFDRWWFSGYPAFEFYGSFGHLLASLASGIFEGPAWNRAVGGVNLVVVLAITAFPLAGWYFANALAERNGVSRAVTAALACCAAAVYLATYEPGMPAGFRYGLTGGVFSQVVAWPLALVYLGAVVGRQLLASSVLFAILLWTHSLTAIGVLVGAAAVLAAGRDFKALVRYIGAGLGLSCLLWLPMLMWGDYTAGGATWSERGGLAVLFDGWLDFLSGKRVGPAPLLAEGALGAALVRAVFATGHRVPDRTLLYLLLAILVFTGAEMSEVIPLGIHYGRLTAILAAFVLFAAAGSVKLPRNALVTSVAVIFWAAAVQVVVSQLDRFPGQGDDTGALAAENRLLEALAELPPTSRVLIEYPVPEHDSAVFPGKYLESRLFDAAGLETVNGLLYQSSRPYRVYGAIMRMLGGHYFGPRSPAVEHMNLSPTQLLDSLRRNSVTHIVAARARLARNLTRLPGVDEVARVDRYRLFALDQPEPRVRIPSRPLVGYLDLAETLPFRYLDEYVELDRELSGAVRLVELQPWDLGALPVDALIVNSIDPATSGVFAMTPIGSQRLPVYYLSYEAERRPRQLPRHSRRELIRFEMAADYLDGLHFTQAMRTLDRNRAAGPSSDLELQWSGDGQALAVRSLQPGEWHEISYSYSPAWRAAGNAVLRRGSAGHMFLYAGDDSTAAELAYSRWRTGPVRFGVIISLLSLLVILMGGSRFTRKRENGPAA